MRLSHICLEALSLSLGYWPQVSKVRNITRGCCFQSPGEGGPFLSYYKFVDLISASGIVFYFRIVFAYPLFWRCGMRTAGDRFVSSSPGSSVTPSCGRSWAWDNRSPQCIWQLFEPAQVPSKVRGCIGWDNSSTQVGTV